MDQQISIFNTSTLDLCLKNMRTSPDPMLSDMELIICNHTDDISEGKLGNYHLSLKAMMPDTEIVFEGEDGEIHDDFSIELPYDLKAGHLELSPDMFATFYVNAMDWPERYDGKEISFAAELMRPKGTPADMAVPDRGVIICCETDIRFCSLFCHYVDAQNFKTGDWVKVRAKTRKENARKYGAKGPILYTEELTQTGPIVEVVAFGWRGDREISETKHYRAAAFDMDGTILGIITDLTISLSEACRLAGHHADLTKDDVRHFFGGGAEVATQRVLVVGKGYSLREVGALGVTKSTAALSTMDEVTNAVITTFAVYCGGHRDDATRPYPGILVLLRKLKAAGVRITVVFSKLDEVVRVLNRVHFGGLFEGAKGERPDIRRKLAPDMVLTVLESLQVRPEEAVYTGDTEVNMLIARNSDMDCISVGWGFRGREALEVLDAKRTVDRAEEAFDLIVGNEDI